MPRKKKKVEEFIEEEDTIEKKSKEVADLIQKSKHLVFFTGAGISTSTGIPDFRGPNGIWSLQEQGIEPEIDTDMLDIFPSFAHMAISALVKNGICKYVISQNCDGLHLKSGIPPTKLSELHGNIYLEKCEKCHKEYFRDFRCDRDNEDDDDHSTGRKCSKDECGGDLMDTIINFGEDLPEDALNKAKKNCDESDLCIVLGSSLTVTPANHLAGGVGEDKRNLVIVNLQVTDYDDVCKVRVFDKIDNFMKKVMTHLKVETEPFILKRRVLLSHKDSFNSLTAIDLDGVPITMWEKIKVGRNVYKEEPFKWKGDQKKTKITLFPFGHYQEPEVKLEYDFEKDKIFELEYSPYSKEWTIN